MKKLFIVLAALLFALPVFAEETYTTAYIMCQPHDYINVRAKPSTRSESYGRFISGDSFQIDGRESKGFLHAKVALESNEGWIYAGYVVFDEPQYCNEQYVISSNGRVAALKYIDGPRRCWVKKGSTVTVVYTSSEWCLTNKGYIRTKYLAKAEQ